MKKTITLLLLLILFISCSTSDNSGVKTPSSKTQTSTSGGMQTGTSQEKAAEPESTVINCTDTDGMGTTERGKVILMYSNGQKESLNDYCGEGEFGFQIEYYCDGLTAKTKLNKCNATCTKGVCG